MAATEEVGSETDAFTENANLITEGLWLGSEDAGHAPKEVLLKHGVRAIVVAGFGITASYDSPESPLSYLKLKSIDLPIYDITQDVRTAHDFIRKHIHEHGHTVLVHCARGKSRSASLVIGHLILSERISFEDAYFKVKKGRPIISINAGFEQNLRKLAESIKSKSQE